MGWLFLFVWNCGITIVLVKLKFFGLFLLLVEFVLRLEIENLKFFCNIEVYMEERDF